MNIWGRRAIGALQIAGGGSGITLIYQVLLSEGAASEKAIVSFLIAGVSIWGLVAGIMLIEKHPRAIPLSIVLQAIQIPVITSTVICYHVFSGLAVTARIYNGLTLNWLWGSSLEIHFFGERGFSIGLNFVPIIILLYLKYYEHVASARIEESRVGGVE